MSVEAKHLPPADSVQPNEITLREEITHQKQWRQPRGLHNDSLGPLYLPWRSRPRNPDGRKLAWAPSNILSEPENPETESHFAKHQLTISKRTGPHEMLCSALEYEYFGV